MAIYGKFYLSFILSYDYATKIKGPFPLNVCSNAFAADQMGPLPDV